MRHCIRLMTISPSALASLAPRARARLVLFKRELSSESVSVYPGHRLFPQQASCRGLRRNTFLPAPVSPTFIDVRKNVSAVHVTLRTKVSASSPSLIHVGSISGHVISITRYNTGPDPGYEYYMTVRVCTSASPPTMLFPFLVELPLSGSRHHLPRASLRLRRRCIASSV